MADKINKEECISRVYQFLNTYNGDWKTDADRNGDGVIIKTEFSTFMKTSDFDWDGLESKQDDVITAFWKSIDIITTGKLNNGKNISDRGALNGEELAVVGANIVATDIVNRFMQTASMPDGLKGSRYEQQWFNSVKAGMVNNAAEYLKKHKDEFVKLANDESALNAKIKDMLGEEKLKELFRKSAVKATADYKANEMKDMLTSEYGNLDYTVGDDKTLTSIINAYIKQLKGDEDLEQICKDIEIIINAYMETAKTNSEQSIQTITKYDGNYNKYKLNPLQKAVLTAQMQETILEKVKTEKPEVYNTCQSVLVPSVENYVKNIINTVNNFDKIKDNMESYIASYLQSEELANIQKEYEEQQRAIQTARAELNTYISTVLAEGDEAKTAIIKEVMGTTDASEISSILEGLKTLEEIQSKKTQIETKLKALEASIEAERAANAAKYQASFGELADLLDYFFNEHSAELICGHSEIHTEFGINSDGTMAFQEADTAEVYNNLEYSVLKEFKNKNKEAYDLIGEKNLKKIFQSAWIMAYNSFPSSQKNRTANFIQAVLNNMDKILNSIKAHPENLAVYTSNTAYANSNLTDGLIHYGTNTTYGNDERIYYGGAYRTEGDTVHIENTDDDPDYQATMSALLSKILKTEPYKNIDPDVITHAFREAQIEALKIAQNNIYDCPYGTNNNGNMYIPFAYQGSRVEDETRYWGGNDSREGDKSTIHMNVLVQLTLYCFDRLLYKELAG